MIFLFFSGFCLTIITSVIIYNYFTAPVLVPAKLSSDNQPLLSVLIPARNEEANIAGTLSKALKQDYNNFEVIVLDDQSTDRTAQIVVSFTENNKDLKLIRGKSLPGGWLGKNWACHQLSLKARGEFLLFLDADVALSPQALSSAIAVLNKYNAALLSVFPSQKFHSFGEILVVPLMNWLLLSFLPLKKVYESTDKSFTAANGQFMLWRKRAYNSLGGHYAVADKVVEDMEIARLAKKNGHKIITLLGGSLVSCRMYRGFKSAFLGFSKNFFPGFNIGPAKFTALAVILFTLFFVPYLLVFVNSYYIFVILIILAERVLISALSRQNVLLNLILHPFQLLVLPFLALNSVISTYKRDIVWKGRKL